MLRWLLVAALTITTLITSLPAGSADPWATPAGRAAAAEIRNLRDLGVYDDLREYHLELTEALREGSVNFIPWPSRIECPGMRKPTAEKCAVAANVRLLYRVMPLAVDPASATGFVRWSERGRNRVVVARR